MIAARAEDLLEDAPCGFVTTTLDGTILQVNRTFERWTGLDRDVLVGRRFQQLLSPGGRIYHETHLRPLLHMQGAVREIALDVVTADGGRLPTLVTAVVQGDIVQTLVFDATDRRRYEQELLRTREREREVAHDLQRSLLQGALPEDERLELAVVYKPAGRGSEVGGDWYDAFWLDDGARVGVVVGDVVGRGLEAAAAMGQLRSALRALASTGLEPTAALQALDRYARRHAVGEMTTVVLAHLELATRELRWTCAGHLPPAVAEPGRPARLLWDGRGAPVDADPAAALRPEARATLAPGATLVLYSDGLVERADRSLVGRLEELVRALDEAVDAPVGDVAQEVAARMLGREPPLDDVCVLALRVR